MAKTFVFLEITEPEVICLIQGVRQAGGGRLSSSNVHLTIRGPYTKAVPASRLKAYERALMKAPLLLDGYGSFQAGMRFVVFVRASHPELRRIWWKPDYPIKEFGFNPHITLYEGDNEARAARLLEFLRREGIKLLIHQFKVTNHVSDHVDLFPSVTSPQHPLDRLWRAGLVRPDFFGRLQRFLAGGDAPA